MNYKEMHELKWLNAANVCGWYRWLQKKGVGCCHLEYRRDGDMIYSVCMGWHDCGDEGYKIAWKIGRQTVRNYMQADLDIDFEMPYDEGSGYVDDTLIVFETEPMNWGAIAADMRREAVRVANDWIIPKEEEECKDGIWAA